MSAEAPAKPIKALAAMEAKDCILKEWTYVPRPFQSEDVEIRVIAAGVCVS